MQFWDSSALFALMVKEPHTVRARAILEGDRDIVSSFITPIELCSALWRKRHVGALNSTEDLRANANFAALSYNWITIGEIDRVIAMAISVVSRHALRTGDAIQLAAAAVASEAMANRPLRFVTFDKRLATAARAEGFAVLT